MIRRVRFIFANFHIRVAHWRISSQARITTKQHCLLVLTLATFAGCGSMGDVDSLGLPDELSSALKSEYEVELYSLNPEKLDEEPESDFHGWEVLGSEKLDGDKGREIVEGFKSGLASAPDYVAGCFNPRHGLRISSAEKVVDLVICFQCVQIYVFVGDERIANLRTSASPRQLFDKVVAEHRLPMPGPANP